MVRFGSQRPKIVSAGLNCSIDKSVSELKLGGPDTGNAVPALLGGSEVKGHLSEPMYMLCSGLFVIDEVTVERADACTAICFVVRRRWRR